VPGVLAGGGARKRERAGGWATQEDKGQRAQREGATREVCVRRGGERYGCDTRDTAAKPGAHVERGAAAKMRSGVGALRVARRGVRGTRRGGR